MIKGMHYCERHQGNYYNYDPSNCAVCKLRAALQLANATLEKYFEHTRAMDIPINDHVISQVINNALRDTENEH